MNTYLSISDQKNNEVVRLLTIFSAFFLPLTFIAGVYGMNFDFMPELKWKVGYYFSISLMITVVIVIYFWFRKKKIL
jgi:magnesium transporter